MRCKIDPRLLRVIWMSEFPGEVMKLLVAFRCKFVCDISHMNILPNGVVVSSQLKPNLN